MRTNVIDYKRIFHVGEALKKVNKEIYLLSGKEDYESKESLKIFQGQKIMLERVMDEFEENGIYRLDEKEVEIMEKLFKGA